MGRSARNSV